MDFPVPESGLSLLFKASNLRRSWNKLLANKLEGKCKIIKYYNIFIYFCSVALKQNVENALGNTSASINATKRLEMNLWHDLALYMNSEVPYTLKRLLPADIKVSIFH